MFCEALLFLSQKSLMKYLSGYFLLAVFIFLSIPNYSQNRKFELNPELVDDFYHHEIINLENENLCYNLIEKDIYDLDQDGMKDTIFLYHIDLLKNDPGDFHRIKIVLANGVIKDLINIDGWIKSNRYKPKINEIDSEYVTIGKHKEFNILMCFGWYYASDPPRLTVLDFTKGKPRLIFNKNFATEELILVQDTLLKGTLYHKEAGSEIEPDNYCLQIIDNRLKLVVY